MIKAFLLQMKEKFNLKMTLKQLEREAKLDELRYQVNRETEKLIEKREAIDKGIVNVDDRDSRWKDTQELFEEPEPILEKRMSMSERQSKALSDVIDFPLPMPKRRWGESGSIPSSVFTPEPESTLDDFLDIIKPRDVQDTLADILTSTFSASSELTYSTMSRYNDFIIRVFPQKIECGSFYIDGRMNIVDADTHTVLFNADTISFDVLATKQVMNVSLSTGSIFYIMLVPHGLDSKIEIHTNMILDTSKCDQFVQVM